MMDARRITWTWILAAFCASLTLATGIVTIFGLERGVPIALAATARLAFLMFWPAYAGGALTSLFGNVFSPLREHARDLGLAFASALFVHLGLVVYLCAIGDAPGKMTFVIFGVAAGFTYLLALLSIRRLRQALPQKLWLSIRFVAMNYIAFAFLVDFVKFPFGGIAQHHQIPSLRCPRNRWSGVEARRIAAEAEETYASIARAPMRPPCFAEILD